MIKKIILYYQVLYKGELLKKIEYKLKDFIGYFYIRNFFYKKNKLVKLNNFHIQLNNLNVSELKTTNNYKIFNETIEYSNVISKIKCINREFWRKTKLSNFEDIKIIWEYNRLQFLLPISINYLITNDKKYKNLITDILDCWVDNNEFEYSLNWNSNLEVSIRAINISLTLLLLNDDYLNNKYANLLYLHVKHIYSDINYSNKCIPNNHVIGEATALLMLSRIIDIKDNKKWYKRSIKILNKYIDIIDDNGVSIENSFSYQFFVTKMYILSLCFIEDQELFNKLSNKINKSLNVLKYCFDGDICLNYGDNDDGFLYSISNNYNLSRDINQYYNLFTNDEKTIETNLYINLLKILNPNKNIISFNKNKQKYIYTKKIFIYKNNGIILFFNAKNIRGHAHNDSLAINLIVNGKEIIMDSGTYSYNISKSDREYYKSRDAHSTILFENINANSISTFRWRNYINSYIDYINDNKDYIKVIGVIDGICSREIKIYNNCDKIEVIDYNYTSNELCTNYILPFYSQIKNRIVNVENVNIKFECNDIDIKNAKISSSYLTSSYAKKYTLRWFKKITTTIEINNRKKD